MERRAVGEALQGDRAGSLDNTVSTGIELSCRQALLEMEARSYRVKSVHNAYTNLTSTRENAHAAHRHRQHYFAYQAHHA